MRFPPGFADGVMLRIREYRRQKRRRRTIAIVLTTACLLGGALLLSRRLMHDGQRPGIPQTLASAARPPVAAALAGPPAQRQAAATEETPRIVHTRPHAVRPPMKVAPVQPSGPLQTAAKEETPETVPDARDPAVTIVTTSAAARPQEVVITIDGKVFYCPADILQAARERGSVIEQVRDGKLVRQPQQIPSIVISRCRAASTQRE